MTVHHSLWMHSSTFSFRVWGLLHSTITEGTTPIPAWRCTDQSDEIVIKIQSIIISSGDMCESLIAISQKSRSRPKRGKWSNQRVTRGLCRRSSHRHCHPHHPSGSLSAQCLLYLPSICRRFQHGWTQDQEVLWQVRACLWHLVMNGQQITSGWFFNKVQCSLGTNCLTWDQQEKDNCYPWTC